MRLSARRGADRVATDASMVAVLRSLQSLEVGLPSELAEEIDASADDDDDDDEGEGDGAETVC